MFRLFRRWRYRKLLIQMETSDISHSNLMCHNLKRYFPWLGIDCYKELWDNRPIVGNRKIRKGTIWFEEQSDRVAYVEQAIKLTYDRQRQGMV